MHTTPIPTDLITCLKNALNHTKNQHNTLENIAQEITNWADEHPQTTPTHNTNKNRKNNN